MIGLDEIIACASKDLNLSYCYATYINQKVILNGVRKFPILIRTFGEEIKEGKNQGSYSSELLLFFADTISSDGIDKISPVVRRMQCVAFEFVKELRRCGIICTVGKTKTGLGEFDSKVAGVSMELTVEYDLNCNG